jgi:hypothetical protein
MPKMTYKILIFIINKKFQRICQKNSAILLRGKMDKFPKALKLKKSYAPLAHFSFGTKAFLSEIPSFLSGNTQLTLFNFRIFFV